MADFSKPTFLAILVLLCIGLSAASRSLKGFGEAAYSRRGGCNGGKGGDGRRVGGGGKGGCGGGGYQVTIGDGDSGVDHQHPDKGGSGGGDYHPGNSGDGHGGKGKSNKNKGD